MKKSIRMQIAVLGAALAGALTLAITGCTAKADRVPVFKLAWSEYPSWSTFGVAHELGLINGKAGEMGPIEKKWNVDIDLMEADYDSCLTAYATAATDAVCITNMDVLNPALSRASVAILPTSTSNGADACIVVGIDDVEGLRGKKVYGLEKSVSEYCFVRNLEELGEKEADHDFTNMDPGAAAVAMQGNQAGYEAIVVWNPYVLETLKNRPGAKVLFDSTTIPGEIVDMVVMSKASLGEPGGDRFAAAVIDAFYQISEKMAAPASAGATLLALGEKFSALDLKSMKTVVKQTEFYATPAAGKALFTGTELPAVMERVVDFCVDHDIITEKPSVAFGHTKSAALVFDSSYIDKAVAGK